MARIRSVKPEFWGDRKLAASVSRDARLLYIALWNQADEWARVQGDARWVKGHCLPYDDDLDLDAIDRLVGELTAAGRVQRYEHEGDPFLFLPKLAPHQRLEPTKVPSRLPEPPAQPDLSVKAPESESCADESAPRADEPETIDALHVAGGMLHVAGSRGAALRADDPPDDPTSALLAEHVNAYDQPPPPSALTPVKREIMRLVSEQVPPERIRAGLARMRGKGLAASLLPQLVTEASQTTRSTTDERVAAGAALVARYEESGQ